MEAAMKYGVILPIWQLSVRDAETLSLKAEDLGLDGVFVPDHILAPPAQVSALRGRHVRAAAGADAAPADLGPWFARHDLVAGAPACRAARRRLASSRPEPRRHREGDRHDPRARGQGRPNRRLRTA